MQLPTMADVAKAAGVSKNTVSLTLRGSPRVAQATRQRIVRTAETMGYRLNPTATPRFPSPAATSTRWHWRPLKKP